MPEATEIVKLDAEGKEILRYPATLQWMDAREGYARVEAWFALERGSAGLFDILRGDRMIEHFWSTRYYNVFEVYAPNGEVRGFYCNITRPAHIGRSAIAAEDLELDFVADATGRTAVLDREEFDALAIDADERRAALGALEELATMHEHRSGPFSRMPDAGAGGAPEERPPGQSSGAALEPSQRPADSKGGV